MIGEGWHDLGCRPVDGFGKERGAVRGLQVELDGLRSCARRFNYEAGGRIDRAAGADRKEEIALAKRLVDLIHPVGYLAEPDHVRAHGARFPASGARGRKHDILAPVVAGVAGAAPNRKDLAMHVDQVCTARRFVQTIDVLGNGEDGAGVLGLESGQRLVRRVGPGSGSLRAAGVVEILYQRRVAPLALGRCHFDKIIIGPNTAFVTEGAEPRLGRKTGASEDDNALIRGHG